MQNMRFKCCNKDLNNYCCVSCNNIFHKSCSGRLPNLIKIDQHKIFCSKKCAAMEDDKNDQINILKSLVGDLKQEIETKDMHINKLKRQSQAFETDVYEIEQNYNTEISNQKVIIQNLEHQLQETLQENLKINKEIEDKFCNHCEKVKQDLENFKTNIRELKLLNSELRNQICTLKLEDKNNKNELEYLKKLIVNFEDKKVIQTQNKSATTVRSKSAQVLVLTDDYGNHLYGLIKNNIGEDFILQVISKPGANFKQVTSNIVKDVQNLTTKDFVIILAGTNDVNIKKSDIFHLIKMCMHTNLVICTVPLRYDQPILNRSISFINEKLITHGSSLKQDHKNFNLIYLHNKLVRNDYIFHSLRLKRSGLLKISGSICDIIKRHQLVQKDLLQNAKNSEDNGKIIQQGAKQDHDKTQILEHMSDENSSQVNLNNSVNNTALRSKDTIKELDKVDINRSLENSSAVNRTFL